MTAEDAGAECFVCRKHRDGGSLIPGGPIAEDELVLVSHIVTGDALGRGGTTAYMGHLFVEPRRHAPGLADLTDAEAQDVGWWCTRASRAPREVAGAEHVYAAVIGDGVPHLHVHLLPRYPVLRASTGGLAWTSGHRPAAVVPRTSKCVGMICGTISPTPALRQMRSNRTTPTPTSPSLQIRQSCFTRCR